MVYFYSQLFLSKTYEVSQYGALINMFDNKLFPIYFYLQDTITALEALLEYSQLENKGKDNYHVEITLNATESSWSGQFSMNKDNYLEMQQLSVSNDS